MESSPQHSDIIGCPPSRESDQSDISGCPPPQMETVHLGITVNPAGPPPPPVVPTIPAKLLAIMKKYPDNWRISQLAHPKMPVKKFVPIPVGYVRPRMRFSKLSDEIKYYADQIAKPNLRTLYVNENLFGDLTKRLQKNFHKNINKTWKTIYNYYKMMERSRRLRQLRQQKSIKEKAPTIDEKIMNKLATPKKLFEPEPLKTPSNIFDAFDRLDELATAKVRHVDPPYSNAVSPAAMAYVPTDNILSLARPLERLMHLPPPLEPGKVTKGALRYNASPRILEMAQAKQRNEASKEDEADDRWVVSKNALKYKPTQRILELAKPLERD